MLLVGVVVLVFVTIAGMWKVFEKAGQPGWAVLVPIYNLVIMARIGGKSGWWALLVLLPYIGWIFHIILSIEIAKNFNRGWGTGLGLTFLGFIFYPVLGFGSAQYGMAAHFDELEEVFA